jgi:L,D-transpeptidase catalytic domain
MRIRLFSKLILCSSLVFIVTNAFAQWGYTPIAGLPPMPQVTPPLPFIMPPDADFAIPNIFQVPGMSMNPFYTGETFFQPPGQDPYTYTRYTLPPDTSVHVHHRSHYNDDDYTTVDVDTDKTSDADSSSQNSIPTNQDTFAPVKDLKKQKKVSNDTYQVTNSLNVYQRTAVQNDEDSKTQAGTCIICKQLQANRKALENQLNLILASKKVPKLAFQHAQTCFLKLLDAGKLSNADFMTVIDYNQSDDKKRLYLINIKTGAVEQHMVSQGKNADKQMSGNYAINYSNAPCSNQTSPGCYLTGEVASGGFGASLKLDGQDPGRNDNARKRCIIAHWYPKVAGDNSEVRAKDTLGCFGLGTNRGVVDHIINEAKDGGAWYAEENAAGVFDPRQNACANPEDANRCGRK